MGGSLGQLGSVFRGVAILFALLSLSPRVSHSANHSGESDWLTVVEEPSDEKPCLEVQALRLRVLEVRANQQPPLGVTVEVDDGVRSGFRLLEGETVVAERSFDDLPQDCIERSEAFAVAIAIALDNFVVLRAEEQTRASEPTSSSPAGEPEGSRASSAEPEESVDDKTEGAVVEPPRTPREDRASRGLVRARVGLGGGLIGGALPRPAGHLQASFAVTHGDTDQWSIGVSAALTAPVESSLGRGTVETDLIFGKLSACWEPRWGLLRPSACGLFLLGRMEAEAMGVLGAQGARSWWSAGGLGAGLRVPSRGPWGLHVGAQAHVNFLRPGVALEVEGREDIEDNAPHLSYSALTEAFWLFP